MKRVLTIVMAAAVLSAGAAALLAALGEVRLRVTSEPPGAVVTLDGRPLGVTPLELRADAPRAYEFRFARAGCADAARRLDLGRLGAWRFTLLRLRRTTLAVRAVLPEMPQGGLTVTSEPSGAAVRLDGEEAGATPLDLAGLRPGPHRLRLAAEGREPAEEIVEVRAGETAKVHRALRTRAEAYYLGRIKKDPTDLVAYTELLHHYVVNGEFAAATAHLRPACELSGTLSDGADAKSRFFQELEKMCTRQFDYPETAAAKAWRKAIREEVRRLADGKAGSGYVQKMSQRLAETN